MEYSLSCNQTSKPFESIFDSFISFCVNHLNIQQPFKLFLVDKDHNIDMSLAAFNIYTNDIHVRSQDRFLYDVCRSIAHELVHLQQKQEDRLNLETYTDIGGQVEDEANAVAGQICKIFVNKFNCKWIYNI